MKPLFFLILFIGISMAGCSYFKDCESGQYTIDNRCCNYICDKSCPNGYLEGTCNCECKAGSDTSLDNSSNVDLIFADAPDNIIPPNIPN